MYDLLRVQKDIITSQSVTTVATPSKIFDNLTLDFFLTLQAVEVSFVW